MIGKKIQILRAATKLFSEKGFHATSIQEIADSLGIAKGSVYSYFPSKDELLLSIYKYYYEMYEYKLSKLGDNAALSSKEVLIAKIEMIFNSFYEHRAFLFMQIKEQAFKSVGDTYTFMLNARLKGNLMYAVHVKEMFVELPEQYVPDCVTIISGMIDSYMKVIFLDQYSSNHRQLAEFIVERLEDMVAGLIARRPASCLSSELIQQDRLIAGLTDTPTLQMRLNEELMRVKERCVAAGGAKRIEETLGALQVLEEELSKAAPRNVVIKGMAAQIANNAAVDATGLLDVLETLLGFDDIDE